MSTTELEGNELRKAGRPLLSKRVSEASDNHKDVARFEWGLAELTAVYQACLQFQKLTTPEVLAHEVIRTLEDTLGYEYCAVLLVEETTQYLVPFVCSQTGDGSEAMAANRTAPSAPEIRVGQGICGWVAKTGRPARVVNVAEDNRYYQVRQDVRSELCVPMRLGGRVIGVVNVESSEPNAYTELDQKLLETVASQIAVAIENAQLFAQIQTYASEQERHVARRTEELDEIVHQFQQEINERRRTEDALRGYVESYRLLFETMVQGVVYLDAKGTVVSANPAAESILGLSLEQMKGCHLSELDWQALREDGSPFPAEYQPALVALRQGVEVRNVVMGISQPGDGRRRWVMVNAVPQFDEGNEQPTQVYMTIDDVTERQRVAKALQQSEAKYRTLVEQLPAIIYISERVGSRHMVYVSPQIKAMLGYSPDEWTSSDELWHASLHPDDRSRVLSVLAAGEAAESTSLSIEYRLHSRDRQVRWFRDESEVVQDVDGQPLFLQGVMMDITARKEVEAAVQQRNEELAELNEMLMAQNEELNAFNHTVAHDLKNPLAIILGFAEVLSHEHSGGDDETLSQSVEVILENARRMENIVDELLLLAEVRQLDEIEMQPLDMAEIVEETRKRLSNLTSEYQAMLIVPDTWPVALGHEPWVQEIWVNYVSNAIKYGGRPPRIEVGSTVQSDGMVRFWVSDNGPGIAPEDQARLFAPFTKLHQVRIQGHGLGLSIVQRIATKLGGSVGVNSQLGEGSTFWFTLPQAP